MKQMDKFVNEQIKKVEQKDKDIQNMAELVQEQIIKIDFLKSTHQTKLTEQKDSLLVEHALKIVNLNKEKKEELQEQLNA